MFRKEEYLQKAYLVKDTFREQLNKKSMKYNYHEADVTVLEGVIARGDRKVARVIKTAYENGALYDSWSDYFDDNIWQDAFKACDIDIEFYTLRQRSLEELFPWDFIDCGVNKEFLIREWKTALANKESPNCRQACLGCGAKKYKGGVCYESTN